MKSLSTVSVPGCGSGERCQSVNYLSVRICVLSKIKENRVDIPGLVMGSWQGTSDHICASTRHLASLLGCVCYSDVSVLFLAKGEHLVINPIRSYMWVTIHRVV